MRSIVSLVFLFYLFVLVVICKKDLRYRDFKTLYELIPLKQTKKIVKHHDYYGYFYCPQENMTYCDPYNSYRKYDGSCNNLKHTWWGRSLTPFKRLLRSRYENGTDQPRLTGKLKHKLPNPRLLSLKIKDKSKNFTDVNNFVLYFSQFIGNDIVYSKIMSGFDGDLLSCQCNSQREGCLSIDIPEEDSINQERNCLIQIRHASSDNQFKCSLGYREQINIENSFFDLSSIYGRTIDENRLVREFRGGRLSSTHFPMQKKNEIYPKSNCPLYRSKVPDYRDNICFVGDIRSNYFTHIGAFHILWLREHNRIATRLGMLNPEWDDEKIFQETRKIVIAEYTHIIYKEIVPIIIGSKMSTLFDLYPKGMGEYFMGYDGNVMPNVDNEFSLAFRFGHVLAPSYFSLLSENFTKIIDLKIHKTSFDSSFFLGRNSYTEFVRGLLNNKIYSFRQSMNDEMRNSLMYPIGSNNPHIGHSLFAWNINRGRDRGIQPYNYYREMAGLKRARTFDELTYISKEKIEDFKALYKNVDDIDFWIGCVSETPLEDSLVGPTMAYIIARTFRNSKIGDRYFYENGHEESLKFSIKKLNELKKASIARIICDNVDMKEIQENPAHVGDEYENPLVNCNRVPVVSLNEWRANY